MRFHQTGLKAMIALCTMPMALTACQDEASLGGGVRGQVRAVGSSTVFPFATAMVERFVDENSGHPAPIIESTGTGPGMKQFCAGIGAQHPDIEDASRRMKKSEFEDCVKNGVREIIEVQVGVDGLALAESRNGPGLKLSLKQVYEALAANPYGRGPNKAQRWSDVDPALPAIPITVYGPPSTSGTRDSLAELVLTKGCESDPAMKALKKSDEKQHKKLCTQIREDGRYVDAGENDNLIVQKLSTNPDAIGVFGYSYLMENPRTLKDIPLEGVQATYDAVANGKYPGARPLYIYVKKRHMMAIPGLAAYVATWPKYWNPGGLLAQRGMVAASAAVRAKNAQVVRDGTLLDGADLK